MSFVKLYLKRAKYIITQKKFFIKFDNLLYPIYKDNGLMFNINITFQNVMA